MPYKIVVDWNRCESNAVCEGLAPEVFAVNDDDELDVLQEVVGDDVIDKVRSAVERCPKAALSLEEV